MYLGLDLHKRYSQIAVMTEDGKLVAEQRLENNRDDPEAFASEYAGSEVPIEATGSYRYVYDILDQVMDVSLRETLENAGYRRGQSQNRLD